MTKCPSTTDVVVNCGTRRVSIQYFSSALYGRVFFVFFLQFSRLQFPVFMHFSSCAIYSEWQTWENNFQVFGLFLALTHKIAKFVLSSATTNNIYVRATAAAAASGVLKVHVAVAKLSNAAALCKVSFFMLPNSMSEAGSILTFTCTQHFIFPNSLDNVYQ